jgi:hypothetical protein
MTATLRALTKKHQDLTDKIASLQRRRTELDLKARATLAKVCERAGLLDIAAPPSELEAALREVAARFRSTAVTECDPRPPTKTARVPAKKVGHDAT